MTERRAPLAGDLAGQLARYGLVGLASNAAGYLVYLALTATGLAPRYAMSLLYTVGALAGFFGNRRLTFSHRGSVMSSGLRYALAHLGGYALNLFLLTLFAERLHYPHQAVQAAAVFVVAAYLFVTFRLFVFPAHGAGR